MPTKMCSFMRRFCHLILSAFCYVPDAIGSIWPWKFVVDGKGQDCRFRFAYWGGNGFSQRRNCPPFILPFCHPQFSLLCLTYSLICTVWRTCREERIVLRSVHLLCRTHLLAGWRFIPFAMKTAKLTFATKPCSRVPPTAFNLIMG
jgi:hypothetical protein